jgi:hypothetical protein
MFEYILLILSGYITFYYYKYKTCEDNYQNERDKLYNNPMICGRVSYDDINNLDTIDISRMKLQKINNHFNYTKEINTNYIYDNVDDFKNCNTVNSKILLDKKTISFYSKINHTYIGGAKLAYCSYMANKEEQKDYFYNSRFWHIFPALKLIWNRNSLPKVEYPLPLYDDCVIPKKFICTYSFTRTSNVKATILYNIMKDLYKCLKLNRQLVCYLPIAFNPTSTIYNNIGIMYLTYSPTDTIETIQQQLISNSYQILGTNFLLYHNLINNNSGVKVRKNVDAVITIIFSEDSIYVSKSWTFCNISEYPVYVAVSSVLNNNNNTINITQTLTVSTPHFDILNTDTKYEEKDNNYYLI